MIIELEKCGENQHEPKQYYSDLRLLKIFLAKFKIFFFLRQGQKFCTHSCAQRISSPRVLFLDSWRTGITFRNMISDWKFSFSVTGLCPVTEAFEAEIQNKKGFESTFLA